MREQKADRVERAAFHWNGVCEPTDTLETRLRTDHVHVPAMSPKSVQHHVQLFPNPKPCRPHKMSHNTANQPVLLVPEVAGGQSGRPE